MTRRLVTDENRRWWMLGAVAFSLFMIMLDNTVVNVALPAIEFDLHLSITALEWTVNAYALTFAVLLLLGGKLADYFGRRRLFLLGLLVFTASSLACGLAESGGTLIAARAVQGVGAALMLPASLSLISAHFAPRERGTAIGIWAGVSLTALGIGPLVGGLVLEHLSWSWIFYVNVPVGAVGLVAAWLLVPESRDESREQRLDLPGLVTSGLALFALTFGLIEGSSYGWGSATIIGCFAAAAVLLAAFVLVELSLPLPMLDLRLFRNSTFAGANVAVLLAVLSMFGVFFFMSIFMQAILFYSAIRTGETFLPLTLVLVLTTPFAGRLADRFGARWPVTVGLSLVGTSLLLSSRLDARADFRSMLPGLVIAGIGFALTMTPITAAVVGSVSVDKAGVASGVVNTFRQIGGSLGIAVMGAIVTYELHGAKPLDPSFSAAFVSGFQKALLVGGLTAFGGAAIAALTIGRRPRLRVVELGEAAS